MKQGGVQLRCFYLDRDACAHSIPYELFVEAADTDVGRVRSFESTLVGSVGILLPWPVKGWEPLGSGMCVALTDPDRPRRFHAFIVGAGALIKTRFGQSVRWSGEGFVLEEGLPNGES